MRHGHETYSDWDVVCDPTFVVSGHGLCGDAPRVPLPKDTEHCSASASQECLPTVWSIDVDLEMTRVAETLAAQFETLPATTVIRVVTDCVEQFPDSDPMFIEQAAQARLRTMSTSSTR